MECGRYPNYRGGCDKKFSVALAVVLCARSPIALRILSHFSTIPSDSSVVISASVAFSVLFSCSRPPAQPESRLSSSSLVYAGFSPRHKVFRVRSYMLIALCGDRLRALAIFGRCLTCRPPSKHDPRPQQSQMRMRNAKFCTCSRGMHIFIMNLHPRRLRCYNKITLVAARPNRFESFLLEFQFATRF